MHRYAFYKRKVCFGLNSFDTFHKDRANNSIFNNTGYLWEKEAGHITKAMYILKRLPALAAKSSLILWHLSEISLNVRVTRPAFNLKASILTPFLSPFMWTYRFAVYRDFSEKSFVRTCPFNIAKCDGFNDSVDRPIKFSYRQIICSPGRHDCSTWSPRCLWPHIHNGHCNWIMPL